MVTKKILQIQNVWKQYDDKPLLSNINFSIKENEIISILGDSGSGKSTLLSIIAGIENPDKGSVLWKDNDISGKPIHKRNFGFLFQNYALFPHLTVFENIAFGLKIKKRTKETIKTRVEEMLHLVQLEGFQNRNIDTLSGGEKQRVALARTIAPKPQLLLLDEPISALDKNLRESLLSQLSAILKIIKTPTIYVTHDQEEAFEISNRIIILREGTIQQFATPEIIFTKPKNPTVAKFVGYKNLIPIQQYNKLGELGIQVPKDKSYLLILPSSFTISKSGMYKIKGKVKNITSKRNWYKLTLYTEIGNLIFEITSQNNIPKIGDEITVSTTNKNAILFY